LAYFSSHSVPEDLNGTLKKLKEKNAAKDTSKLEKFTEDPFYVTGDN